MPNIKKTTVDEKTLWIGGGILLAIIIVFVLGKSTAKNEKKDPSDANPNINPITVNTSTGSISWNPSALVKEVHTAFEVNWIAGRCEALEKASKLQDVQLLALADGYLKVYGKTLRKVINDAWGGDFCGFRPKVIDHMDILQIP